MTIFLACFAFIVCKIFKTLNGIRGAGVILDFKTHFIFLIGTPFGTINELLTVRAVPIMHLFFLNYLSLLRLDSKVFAVE